MTTRDALKRMRDALKRMRDVLNFVHEYEESESPAGGALRAWETRGPLRDDEGLRSLLRAFAFDWMNANEAGTFGDRVKVREAILVKWVDRIDAYLLSTDIEPQERP